MWEISDYHKHRKSLDGTFIKNFFDNQYRELILKKEKENPDAKILRWPEKNPVIGMVKL